MFWGTIEWRNWRRRGRVWGRRGRRLWRWRERRGCSALMVFWGSLCKKVRMIELSCNFWGDAFWNFLRGNSYVSICFPLGLRRAHERGAHLAAGSAILERFLVAAKVYGPVACWGRKDISAGSGSESNSEGSQKRLSKARLADHVAKFAEKCPNGSDVIIEGVFWKFLDYYGEIESWRSTVLLEQTMGLHGLHACKLFRVQNAMQRSKSPTLSNVNSPKCEIVSKFWQWVSRASGRDGALADLQKMFVLVASLQSSRHVIPIGNQ